MEREVILFLSRFTSIKEENITPKTLVNFDLGVDGIDGSDLLDKFSEEYNVDISGISKTYFGPEGVPFEILLWPLFFVLQKLGWNQTLFREVTPLPVSVLIESALAKKWID